MSKVAYVFGRLSVLIKTPDYYYQGSTLRLYRSHLGLSFLPLRLKLLQQLQLCDQFSPKLIKKSKI